MLKIYFLLIDGIFMYNMNLKSNKVPSDFLFSNSDLNDYIHIIQWIKGNNFNKEEIQEKKQFLRVYQVYTPISISVQNNSKEKQITFALLVKLQKIKIFIL